MDTVRQLLQAKGYDIWAVAPESAVLDALKLMADKNIGAVLVIDHGNLVGILSERDYARKVVLREKASRNTPVREIMTERVVCVHPSRPVEECLALMTSGHLAPAGRRGRSPHRRDLDHGCGQDHHRQPVSTIEASKIYPGKFFDHGTPSQLERIRY
jgi:CBS domain-containing protein